MADKRSKDDPPLILNPRNQAEKRINSILRFKERQRRKRAWINFLEIVEWLGEERGDRVNPLQVQPTSEMLRAFDILLRGLLDGDFAEDGRWVVRYLNPHVREEKRMTRAFLLGIIEQCTHEGCTDEETVHHHLSWCWIPRRLFKQWLIRRGLPSPPRFEPREPTQDERGESTPAYAQPSLLPSPEPNPERDNERALAAAIKKRLSAGEEPGVTVQWNQFCDAIRDAADGWADPKKTKLKRGYGDKTIKRIVAQVRMDKQDK